MGEDCENVAREINFIADFLARRDVDEPIRADAVIACACAPPLVLDAVREASLLSPLLLISGGIGHSTESLKQRVRERFPSIPVEYRAEAEIYRDVLTGEFGVDLSKILLENRSTNCGENAWESQRALDRNGVSPQSILLIQDPTMQRRSHASFERAWRGRDVRFISFAPFTPRLENDGTLEPRGQWSFSRFLSLLLGEIPRLRDYGPAGRDFIEHVDVPERVIEAHDRVKERFPDFSQR